MPHYSIAGPCEIARKGHPCLVHAAQSLILHLCTHYVGLARRLKLVLRTHPSVLLLKARALFPDKQVQKLLLLTVFVRLTLRVIQLQIVCHWIRRCGWTAKFEQKG